VIQKKGFSLKLIKRGVFKRQGEAIP